MLAKKYNELEFPCPLGPIIKAYIAEIVSNYAWILELNHRELFYALKRMGSYLAVMCFS